MNICFAFLLFLLFSAGETKISVKGIIVDQAGDAIPGCKIFISTSKSESLTDVEGKFQIRASVNEKHRFDIIIKMGYSPIIRITNVQSNQDSIDLGRIGLVYNKDVNILEYSKLPQEEKVKMKPFYHWGTLIGYFDTSRVDLNTNMIPCPYDWNKNIMIQYASKENEVIIDYNQLISCK